MKDNRLPIIVIIVAVLVIAGIGATVWSQQAAAARKAELAAKEEKREALTAKLIELKQSRKTTAAYLDAHKAMEGLLNDGRDAAIVRHVDSIRGPVDSERRAGDQMNETIKDTAAAAAETYKQEAELRMLDVKIEETETELAGLK